MERKYKFRKMTSEEAYNEILEFKKACNAYGIIPEKKYLDILLQNYHECLDRERKSRK